MIPSPVELVNSRHPKARQEHLVLSELAWNADPYASLLPQINNLILMYILNPAPGSRLSPVLSLEEFISRSSINEYLLSTYHRLGKV